MTERKEGETVTYVQDEQGFKQERAAMMTDARNDLKRTLERIRQWGGPSYRIPDKLEQFFVDAGVKV